MLLTNMIPLQTTDKTTTGSILKHIVLIMTSVIKVSDKDKTKPNRFLISFSRNVHGFIKYEKKYSLLVILTSGAGFNIQWCQVGWKFQPVPQVPFISLQWSMNIRH